MLVRVAQGLERDERIEHRRKNRRQTVRPLEALQHPLLGFAQRPFAERMNLVFGEPLGEFVDPVQPQEKVAPAHPFRIGRHPQISLVEAFGIKFIEGDVVFERAGGLEVIDDRQRHQHRAAPGTHFIEVHVEPLADQDHLARNGRHVIPRKKAQQRQVQLGKGVHPRHTAKA